ncbi:pentatricopeptide repeat-containing protein At2g20710, mitochondrial-like [Sesamum indicum]|uniref:Pentatricopeptide repeat-containing protein At2g20710, mitochondrial-like n=1 Tax=Sesamum indicum TaxID=4182 RepID=A0A6I9U6E2_SESIN|nr:pentatricopeptide repeat-containing protein At2g20710, mitochondrial-like [Sesamum indicum]
MKLFSISSSLSSRAYSFCRMIQSQLFATAPPRTRFSKNGSVSASLYRRISPMGDPSVSVVPALDRWIGEGNTACRDELYGIIKELTAYRRFNHALEVSLWMTNKRHLCIAPFDVALRLKLIFKIFGLEEVENYFNKIPENLKSHHVYLALLNCFTIAKSVDKAESIMQKARDLGYATKPIWYNLMMNLHYQLGNREKLADLLIEMEGNNIPYDHFTHSVRLNACAMASDALGMDKILKNMESNPQVVVHWRTYVIAAEGYLRMGLIDKGLVIVKKLEEQLTNVKKKSILFVFLFKLCAEAGKKAELYRIWNLFKREGVVVNKVYIGMLRSLKKLDDIEGMEKIFQEWESGVLFFDFRIPNFLIDAYCRDGHLEKAEALLTKGISRGGEPLVTTWCHLAGGYLKKNQVPEAVEALKKAISACPARFMAWKNSLTTCLRYLENGDCMDKAEDIINFIRMWGFQGGAGSDGLCSLFNNGELQYFGEDQNIQRNVCEDEELHDNGNLNPEREPSRRHLSG